jgi:hypothetical protein
MVVLVVERSAHGSSSSRSGRNVSGDGAAAAVMQGTAATTAVFRW